MSPPRARLARVFSSPASSSLPPRTLPKYCVRTSCASVITSPLFIGWSACQHACFAGLSACQLSDSQALAEVLTSEARRAERADLLKCYSSCRRVRSPDPWASVGYKAFQDAIVEAGCDAPAPSARAIELQAPPLAHFGHGRLFEGAQAAGRQRPHVDLVLWLAHGDERGVGPESAPALARFALCFSAHLLSPSLPHRVPTLPLRCSSTLFALCESVLFGLHGKRLPPHRAAHRALERIVVVIGAAPAAGGEVLLVDDLLAEGGDPGGPAHYAALPERRPIHSLASSRVSSPTGFPTISSKRPIPSSTTSAMRASR